MFNLCGHKKWIAAAQLGSLLLCMLCYQKSYGQFNRINNPNYEINQWVHFGITLGFNASDFKIKRGQNFVNNDSVLQIETKKGPGFNLGIISDLHLGEHFDFRFIPTLSFAEKRLFYTMRDGAVIEKSVQSTYVDFPFHFKFKSDRLGNFRLYVIGGGKYSIDLASKAEAKEAKRKVKILPSDYSVEYGIGIDYYFPMFKFSPEFKVSHGFRNVLKKENDLVFSRVISKLLSRTFLISFHFE